MLVSLKKSTTKPQFTRHPFTKKKLRVIDTFVPNKSIECPVCREERVEKISIVEPECPGGIRYHIIVCGFCEKPNWVVFLS